MKRDKKNNEIKEISEEKPIVPEIIPEKDSEVAQPEVPAETKLEELTPEEKLQQKEAEIKNLNEQIKRMQADFENWKKVHQKRTEDIQNYAAEPLICNLLPLIDNLERAYEISQKTQDFKSLAEGVGLVLRQMKDILSKEGLSNIKCEGEAFDPNLHEAMLTEETTECPEDHIVEELQRGYTLKDKVIRPSLVKVAKKPKEKRE